MLAPSGPHDLHAPISRTARYKKITKPLLERQRRARINRCLDELKELMVGALQDEGENINKLEKADILELTVRHLHRLQQSSGESVSEVHRFQAGFSHCASEACHFLLNLPGLDQRISRRLVTHLGQCADSLQAPLRIVVPTPAATGAPFSPPVSPPPTRYGSSPRHAAPPLPPGSEYVLSSTPSALELSRPMEGLLMTVNEPGPSSAPVSVIQHHSPQRCSPPQQLPPPVQDESKPWRPWNF